MCRRAGCAPWLAVLTPKVAAQGSGHSQDLKEASDEEVNDDKRSSGEKKRKEARPTALGPGVSPHTAAGVRACASRSWTQTCTRVTPSCA